MGGLDQAIADVEAELLEGVGSAEAMAGRCAAVGRLLDEGRDPTSTASALERLARVLSRRTGTGAAALFDFVAGEVRRLAAPRLPVERLLEAAGDDLRERAAALARDLAGEGRLAVDMELLERMARVDEAAPLSKAALTHAYQLCRRLPPDEWPARRAGDAAEALLLGAPGRAVRRLAARMLDAIGRRPGVEEASRQLGDEAAAFLAPYLEHSGATHQDLADLLPEPGQGPAFLDGLRHASATLGPEMLREVVGRLGWSRLNRGFSAEPLVGLSVGGSFPFVVSPAQARLLAEAGESETLWRRHLIVAHGGSGAGDPGRTSDGPVRRFRDYNLAHAELLEEILAVAPLDEAKVGRIFALMDRVVDDFAALFAASSDEAGRVPAVYQQLRRLVEADLARDRPRGALSAETVRRAQMFEDPQRLDEVSTLHGLKRYLHQQGLRLAFRLFGSHQGADRTVDLLVADERDVLGCEQVIRYLEFEPTPPVGQARLPFAVSLVAAALGRQLLFGRKLPWVTVLGFGNELQLYVNYRNHPAFVRIDLSPPRRGGMIDLEYFAVSQYELDQHPDPSLQAIQRILSELDFDVSRDGFRLRARYDKERAVDLGDVIAKARALFDLLPSLMDVDWVVGDLDYPPAARAEVADAWAGFFARWGVVPAAEVLAASRRKIVVAIEPDPAGAREVVWDGRGAYRDRFHGTPPDGLSDRLRGALEGRGLSGLMAGAPAAGRAFGQRELERAVLEPLAEAARRGEVRETPAGIEPAPGELFQREHEAARLAEILAEGGPGLGGAAQMAALVRGVERQVRFRTTGSVEGHAVQAAALPTGSGAVGLFVLRDHQGIARLAVAARGGVLYRARDASGEPWRRRDELEVAELARLLRSCNYLGAGPLGSAPHTEQELEVLRSRFSTPSPAPVRRGGEERFVPATVAAPGRATGFARFHAAGERPADFDRAVLVARTVRPEDAPWLRHASGIVSTGGGILSHVGLLALELEKPAAIVEGRWAVAPSGAEVLLVRRPQWREVESAVAGRQVVCRTELRDAEEALEQGDLLCLDGESEGLFVLGHDPQALALHQDLCQLEAASMALAQTGSDAEILACRGRLIRALHQLERLLGRLERPSLVRHAVREILTLPRAPLAPEGRLGRKRLLVALLGNHACREEARLSVGLHLDDLRRRVEAASAAVLDDLPHLRSPAEVVLARLGVRRLGETLEDALDLARARGLGDAGPAEAAEMDGACRRRLEAMRASLAGAASRCRQPDGEPWRLRHLLPRLAELAGVLEGPSARAPPADGAEALRQVDAARVRELASRRILGAADGGAELGPLAGGKAAHLGEIARVLGEAAVPPWFAVAQAAYREVLETPVPGSALDALGIERGDRLESAIAWVVAQPGWEARRKADAIRELWQAVALPAGLAEEIAAAYRTLATLPGEDAAVAIRSSGGEEDTEAASWAGQFDTFLFVRGLDGVLEHLKLAWAGFWTERAIDQRRLLGAPPLPRGGGIVVQRMVDARASGVLHTVCAATGQLREMVINAGLGLGEGVVSGTVDVDHVLVSKDGDLLSGDLDLRYRVGDKREQVVYDRERGVGTRRVETRYHQRLRAALEYVELQELVRAAARLEEAFVEPLDIEFAIEGRDLHILQARPIPVFHAAWLETLSRHPLHSGLAAGEKEAS